MDYEMKARSYILAYCNIQEVPAALEFIVPVMVQEDQAKEGAEGLSARSVSGVSETYIEGYSQEVMKILKKFRRIKIV